MRGSSSVIIRTAATLPASMSLSPVLWSREVILNKSPRGASPKGPTLFSFLCKKDSRKASEKQEKVTFLISLPLKLASISGPRFSPWRKLDLSPLQGGQSTQGFLS